MLEELRVRELGVIEDVDIVFMGGLTAITGETGTGKTLVVEALELLVGGRGDGAIVRTGADEATVEGRFVDDGTEIVLSRSVPRSGRSRGFVDGKMAPVSALEETGRELVDLYGQHAHQSLLRPAVQRAALDRFGSVDIEPVRALRAEIAALDRDLESLGGDEHQRIRELDLLRFERDEIEAAEIVGPDEDERLAAEEEILRTATALREAATSAYEALEGDESAGLFRIGEALGSLERFDLLSPHAARLRGLVAELDDAAAELRREAERFEENPTRLEEVRVRRQLLKDLVRKHGDSLADVLAAMQDRDARIGELEASDERRRAVEAEKKEREADLTRAERAVGDARRGASNALAEAVEAHLHRLGLIRARLDVVVPEEGIGDEIEFFFCANPGEASLPLSKVASGGELARAMLALRLVLTTAPATLVFDEVDAGIGGEAALAVGRALAELGRHHQVLVVTHLAQVAAHADHQLVVEKSEVAGRTVARVRPVADHDRVVELSRMLSGHPDSETAREHAAELLEKVRAPSL